MRAVWALIFGLFILLGVEIRIRLAFEQISEWKYGINRLSEEIKKLRDEVTMILKTDVTNKHRYKI